MLDKFHENIKLALTKCNMNCTKVGSMSLKLWIILFTCSATGLTQPKGYELSLSDIIYIQKNDIDRVNDYLLAKGWNLKQMQEKGSLKDYDQKNRIWPGISAEWSFKNSQGKIISEVLYNEATDYNFPENNGKQLPINSSVDPIKSKRQVSIAYIGYNREIFIGIKNEVELSGYKKGDNIIANNSLQSTYHNDRQIVRFTTMNKQGQSQYFVIHLLYNNGNNL